ncbi:MAG TPA: hypothetical protein EYP98_01810, partial [Planctomycetes bacterium]|nr:hypothetical protein [Planctomycetota bacterium]
MSFARTFDAADQKRGLFKHLRALVEYPSLILHNRYMVQNFFHRDLMGRFHGSFLGAWWMLIQPLFMFMVGVSLPFSVAARRRHGDSDRTIA